jgi:hypothetical protein
VENAFSLFKRAIVGNYHKLSPWHLDRYLREFCWRYNRRRMQASIFDMALASMVSRTPLPYKTWSRSKLDPRNSQAISRSRQPSAAPRSSR